MIFILYTTNRVYFKYIYLEYNLYYYYIYIEMSFIHIEIIISICIILDVYVILVYFGNIYTLRKSEVFT